MLICCQQHSNKHRLMLRQHRAMRTPVANATIPEQLYGGADQAENVQGLTV